MSPRQHLRLRVALLVITMLLSLFGARLVQLQGLDSQAYAARAEAAGFVHVDLPAERGDIVDRTGKKLAESVAGLMIIADPKWTAPDASAIARILSDKLGLDYFKTLKQLALPGKRFAYVARRIPATKATKAVAAQNMLRRAEKLLEGLEGERVSDRVAKLRFPKPAPCGRTPLTAEGLIDASPELVVMMTKGLESTGGVEGLLEKVPALAQTPAGQNKRFVTIEDSLILGYGPSTAEVLNGLAVAVLAPEALK